MKEPAKPLIKLKLQNGYQKFLQRLGTPFEVEFTTQSTTIKTSLFKYIGANKHLRLKDLGFVGQVKKCAEKSGKEKSQITGKDIFYFRFSDSLRPGLYEGFTELDVNKAYWQLARDNGYITNEVYTKGLKQDKIVRLVALGAMASKRSCHKFDGEKYTHDEADDKCNELTRSYFFNIAHQLDLLMRGILQAYPQDILFYWVDAIFVKATAKAELIELFRAHGLGMKEKPLTKIVVTAKKGYDLVECYMENKPNPKPFICVRQDNQAQFVINEHNDTLALARAAGLI